MKNTFFKVYATKRWLFLGFILVCISLFGVSVTAAQEVQPDLRINQVTHFGGDAFYCVDRNLNPTNQYSDNGEGGFRLLDQHGQELWFVPTTPTVFDATQHALQTGEYTLVAEGQGTYGPVSLYTFLNGDGDVLFTFNGFDEWGKPNSMTFKFCEPVNPAPPTSTEPGGSHSPTQCVVGYDEFDEEVIFFVPVYGPCSRCEEEPFDGPDGKTCGEVKVPDTCFVVCKPR